MQKVIWMKIAFYSLLFLGVALEVVGDAFYKKWSNGAGLSFIILGTIIYAAGSLFWAASLKYQTLSRAVGIFMVLNMLAAVMVGIFVFKEDLSLANKIGILLGLVSIALIEIG